MSLFENQSYKTLIKAAVAEGNFGPRRTYDPTDPRTDSSKACVVSMHALLTPLPWLLMNPMRSWQINLKMRPYTRHTLLLEGQKAKALHTDRRTDGPTDGPTDGRTDTRSYRVASSRLKKLYRLIGFNNLINSC